MPQSEIYGYHVHVYFNENNIDDAIALTEDLYRQYGYELGQINKKPVGPHPIWSRQVSFKTEDYDSVLLYLKRNHKEFSILVHPLSDNELLDHTQSARWLGHPLKLNLTVFTAS